MHPFVTDLYSHQRKHSVGTFVYLSLPCWSSEGSHCFLSFLVEIVTVKSSVSHALFLSLVCVLFQPFSRNSCSRGTAVHDASATPAHSLSFILSPLFLILPAGRPLNLAASTITSTPFLIHLFLMHLFYQFASRPGTTSRRHAIQLPEMAPNAPRQNQVLSPVHRAVIRQRGHDRRSEV